MTLTYKLDLVRIKMNLHVKNLRQMYFWRKVIISLEHTNTADQLHCLYHKVFSNKKKQKNIISATVQFQGKHTYHCTTSHTTGCQSSIGTSNKYAHKHKTATKRESYSDYHCQIEAGLECKLLVHRVLTNRTLPLFDQNHEYEKSQHTKHNHK